MSIETNSGEATVEGEEKSNGRGHSMAKRGYIIGSAT